VDKKQWVKENYPDWETIASRIWELIGEIGKSSHLSEKDEENLAILEDKIRDLITVLTEGENIVEL